MVLYKNSYYISSLLYTIHSACSLRANRHDVCAETLIVYQTCGLSVSWFKYGWVRETGSTRGVECPSSQWQRWPNWYPVIKDLAAMQSCKANEGHEPDSRSGERSPYDFCAWIIMISLLRDDFTILLSMVPWDCEWGREEWDVEWLWEEVDYQCSRNCVWSCEDDGVKTDFRDEWLGNSWKEYMMWNT